MSYYQARAGVCRAGVTYAGWTPPNFTITLAGTDVTTAVLAGSFEIRLRANEPASCSISFPAVKGVTPAEGNDLKILYTKPNDYLFGGTILQLSAELHGPNANDVIWHCTADGYAWRFNRGYPVTKMYRGLGANAVLRDLIAIGDVDAGGVGSIGYHPGYLPSSLGDVDMDFVLTPPFEAVQQTVAAAGATLDISATRGISAYASLPAATLSLTNSSHIRNVVYEKDFSQVRSRLWLLVSEETATATAGACITANVGDIDVSNIGIFDAAGGYAISGSVLFQYQGTQANAEGLGTGPGVLTNASVTVYNGQQYGDLAVGAPISPLVVYVDSGAATSIVTALGGGGIVEGVEHGITGLTRAAADLRGPLDITNFGSVAKTLSFDITSRDIRPGQLISASITVPITISGTFQVQSVTMTPLGALTRTNGQLNCRVTAGPYLQQRQLVPLLQQLLSGQEAA